ncbi:DUF1294 domain-containing protein [Thalassotalea maritima]|uniref:DUF1294 domain-containing protein n=1 Tax=Thalassotalea maritima TaxID=3242416 RepID=UPI0035274C0A
MAKPPPVTPTRSRRRLSHWSIILATAFLIVIGLGYFLGIVSLPWLLIYAVTSIFTFFVYGIDKWSAKRGSRRVPESSLHILSLIGGWPGAAWAQQLFRHKSRKQPFRLIFIVTVFANLGLLIYAVYYASQHGIAF